MRIGRIQYRKKQDEKKLDKLSTFLVTINTNETGYPEAKVRDVLDYLAENILDYLTYNSESREIQSIEFPEGDVGPGPVLGRIHGHILILIHHRSIIQLNIGKIKTLLKNKLGLTNLHLDVKFIKDQTFVTRKYIRGQSNKVNGTKWQSSARGKIRFA